MNYEAVNPRVHVVGLGSIGTFAAHSLAEVPGSVYANGTNVMAKTREGKTISHNKDNTESYDQGQWHRVSPEQPPITQHSIIENLIVSIKATQTVSALRPLRHRLNSLSHILFIPNGSGMVEEAKKFLFPTKVTRPNYIIGVISRGVTLNSPFNITHTGFSATSIGQVAREEMPATLGLDAAGHSYLLRVLPLVPRFNATAYSFLDIFQIHLEKLAVNAFCNPLCVRNNANNGFLFSIPETRRAVIAEISRKYNQSDLGETAGVTCSMLVDLRQGRETEVRFINGVWCDRGRAVGIPTPMNDDLVRRITEAQKGNDRELLKRAKMS
ncbi:ketopantoate reductase PanE/ApbA-domain-containing protein [Dactylonectria estremocensis]|uniref:Ketopantoate reductase PanE/ApbA-domain-containing protein n=1 Tax=Dactylonectria estremocensis TaxID=1079267 RepID=A0A9P9FAL7_9HYPO|nr:ketopantoate reductase PanE/ApbA-domain-containing protein [Dactylonectria estremocensis]